MATSVSTFHKVHGKSKLSAKALALASKKKGSHKGKGTVVIESEDETFEVEIEEPPTSASVPSMSPTATSSDLQILIATIPRAEDGHVITAEYHNAVRAALIAIANRLGLGPVSEEITVSNAPRLLPQTAQGWAHDQYGAAKKPGGASGSVKGWMEVELPDGARISNMTVYATRTGPGALHIKLLRQKITDPTKSRDLIDIDVDRDYTTTGKQRDVTADDVGPAGLEELRIVNNREHKYLVAAELDNADSTTTAQFSAFQIVLGQ